MSTPIAILDESACARDRLRTQIASSASFEVVGATGQADGLVELAARRSAELLLVSSSAECLADWRVLDRFRTETDAAVILLCKREEERSSLRIRSQAHGVCEVLRKPEDGSDVARFLEELRAALPAVAAARARQARRQGAGRPRDDLRLVRGPDEPGAGTFAASLIAIGASTGGVEATTTLLGEFPADSPPTLLVQHIRGDFAEAHAQALDRTCRCEVRVAQDGDALRAGLVLVAPGDRHLTLERRGGALRVRIDETPKVNQHRPSVDRLFHSVAEHGGRRAVGVLLTGMGVDGAAGLLAMRRAGMRTIAQDRNTSTVFGMPKAALDLGAAQVCLPLNRIAGHALLDTETSQEERKWG